MEFSWEMSSYSSPHNSEPASDFEMANRANASAPDGSTVAPAEQGARAARDRGTSGVTHPAETRPIVEIDDRQILAADDRIAAPDFEPERRRRPLCCLTERQFERTRKRAVLRECSKVLAAAHAVKLHQCSRDRLLDVDPAHSAACKTLERFLERRGAVHPLNVIRSQGVKIAAFDVKPACGVESGDIPLAGREIDHEATRRRHSGAHQTGAEQVAIAVADRERGIDHQRSAFFKARQPFELTFALAHRKHQVDVAGRVAIMGIRPDGYRLDAGLGKRSECAIENRGIGIDLARRKLRLAINSQCQHTNYLLPASTSARAASRSAPSSISIAPMISKPSSRTPLATSMARNRRIASSPSARACGTKSKIRFGRK